MNTPKDKQSQNHENECLDTWICSQDVQDSPWQQSNLGEYEQLSLWKSTPMPNEFSDTTSQISPSTQTSETTIQNQENSTSLQWDFPVRVHQTQEAKQDLNIQLPHSGEKDLDVSLKLNPNSVLWNSLKDLSDEDLELFLPPSIWQDTLLKLKQSRQQALVLGNRGTDCLSFPTLTSNECSTSRPAGQTKCEKWFKDNGLIPSGYQLGTRAMAQMMGFPSNWFEGLTEQYSNKKIISSQVKPQEESEQDISQVEPLHQHKQPLPSEEFSTCPSCKAQTIKLTEGCGICGWLGCDFLLGDKSAKTEIPVTDIPCLIKQPKQPELKGVIQKDLGDRFLVNIGDEAITVSKLFVYPDFSKSVGQIPPSKKVTPPSKNSPTKQRRKKGDGTGYIYRRTITRKGKQYQESYYRYRDESGKLKAKYIPQKLLCKVEQAESLKKPIAEILVLLGGDEINRGEQSSTSDDRYVRREASPLGQNNSKSDELISISRGEQEQRPRVGVRRKGTRCDTPPSTRKRKQGYGAGYIECKPIKRSGKEYKQYWYHWEIWEKGDRIIKKSRYIPKRLLGGNIGFVRPEAARH